MKSCSICKAVIEEENPSILTMGGYANPRYTCKACDGVLEKMLLSSQPEEAVEAMKTVGEHLSRIGCEDNAVIDTVEKMMHRAAERAQAIREGRYDFSLDEDAAEEEIVEIPEELRETEEDRALDEKEARVAKQWDKVLDRIWYVMLGLCGAVFVYILVRLFL